MPIENGKCPKCGSENLEYGVSEIDYELFYPVECKDCGFVGREWHKLIFTGFTDSKGNDIVEIDGIIGNNNINKFK